MVNLLYQIGEPLTSQKEVIMKTYGNLRKNVNAANLDSLMVELRCDSSMLDAIHAAMVEGTSSADNYTDALFGAVCYLRDLIDKFSDEIYEVGENG